jgi:hypothetical protein
MNAVRIDNFTIAEQTAIIHFHKAMRDLEKRGLRAWTHAGEMYVARSTDYDRAIDLADGEVEHFPEVIRDRLDRPVFEVTV